MYRCTLWVLTVIYSAALHADPLPDDLWVKPEANSLPTHDWDYQQGMDFDTIEYAPSDDTSEGVLIYLGVTPQPLDASGDSIEVQFNGQPVVLYQQCNDSVCRYHNRVNTGITYLDVPVWIHLWVTSSQANLPTYKTWLSSLIFSAS